MNPLFMGALAAAPGIMRGIGSMAGAYADAQGVAMGNTPAQNPMALGQDMTNQAFRNFDPNGAMGRGIEQQQMRQTGQNFNVQNKAYNEALKRNYAADSYKNAMSIGKGAIDQYLANSGNNMAAMNQAMGMRW